MRRLVAFLAVEALAAALLAVAGARRADPAALAASRRAASELALTDLALWSGASYCRHLSWRDPAAPFADHPGALEHLPAGSLVPPLDAQP